MPDHNIILPSKPRVISENETAGTFEIEGLYPGYGHTLGNSLRRIILSSLPGAAITQVSIDGVPHEFSTIEGVKEDVITILLNLKRVRLHMDTDEPQQISLNVKGPKVVTAKDIEAPTQVTVLNPDQHIAEITDKNTTLKVDMTVEKGLGYVPKEVLQKDKMEIGAIALDASFTPIKRVNYEVENMRVGDRTDYNRMTISIETDGTLTPRQALERSIEIMINQLKAIVGFKEEEELSPTEAAAEIEGAAERAEGEEPQDTSKIKVEDLELSTRTHNALAGANIRTVGGLTKKTRDDLLAAEGLGEKGVEEIEETLKGLGESLKS